MSSIASSAAPASRRKALVAGGAVLVVFALAFAGVQFAAHLLQSEVVQALGPRASVGEVSLGWGRVELHDVRIAADSRSGWPARDELRAARVQVRPELRSLWSVANGGPWHVGSITVQDGYLSLLRTRDGRLRLLPSLLESPARSTLPKQDAAPADPAAALTIGKVTLDNAAVDFYDASLKTASAHRLQLTGVAATAAPLQLPALNQPIDIKLRGTLVGVQHNGSIALDGRVTPATRDAKLSAQFTGVDLLVLQPYLLRVSEAGVRRGLLDLKLDATVNKMHLHAPGVITLSGLELSSGANLLATFAGVPREAVIAAMNRNGRIELNFTLEGRLDDPRFSINETLALRIATGLAEALGVSVVGVVEGLGGVIKGLFGR